MFTVGLLLLWALCWLLLAVTSNAAEGLQFTAPVINTAVHWLAYGLSFWAGWQLVRPPTRRWFWGARALLWAAIGLQWLGLGLSWGISLLVDFHPSPLGYFASTAHWHTDKVLYHRGSAQLVQQRLQPMGPTASLAIDDKYLLPPAYERTPAYPLVRTVVIEPLVPGLQRVSCYHYVTSPNCGCCGWEEKLDASWTRVDTAAATALRFSRDSALLNPLLARERARNQTEARLRLRARLAARHHLRDTIRQVLTAATHVGANTFSFTLRGLPPLEPDVSFRPTPVVYRAQRVEATRSPNRGGFSVEATFNVEGYPSRLQLSYPPTPPDPMGDRYLNTPRVVVFDNARHLRYEQLQGVHLSITHVDTAEHVLSGTFEGTLRDWAGQAVKVQVSNGRFDVHYTDWHGE